MLAGFSAAVADIQDPPAKKYDRHRKLSRGVANIAFGAAEIPHTMSIVNQQDGNSAAFSYGIISGVHRTLQRFGHGVYEVATAPFPLNRGTYKPYLKSPIRANHGTFQEFPPELGFESSYKYTRD